MEDNVCENCLFYTIHRKKNASALKPLGKGYCTCSDFIKKDYEPHRACKYFLPFKNTTTYI